MTIKYLEDYYEQLHEMYPEMEIKEMDKVLKHGFRSLFTLISYGADFLFSESRKPFVAYFGKLWLDEKKKKRYQILKWRIKLRLQYKFRTKKIWDGYYYFGLSEEEKEKFIPKKGRAKDKVIFTGITGYKVFEEMRFYPPGTYIYRVKIPEERGYTIRMEEYPTRNFEMIARKGVLNKFEYVNEKGSS